MYPRTLTAGQPLGMLTRISQASVIETVQNVCETPLKAKRLEVIHVFVFHPAIQEVLLETTSRS